MNNYIREDGFLSEMPGTLLQKDSRRYNYTSSQIKELQALNENQQKEITRLLTRMSQKDDGIKALRARLDRLVMKTVFFETYLGLIEKDYGDQGKWGNSVTRESLKAVSDKYQQYSLAYDIFKDGQYVKARGEF